MDKIPRSLRWKWRLDDAQACWRRVWRLYVSRAYSWGQR